MFFCLIVQEITKYVCIFQYMSASYDFINCFFKVFQLPQRVMFGFMQQLNIIFDSRNWCTTMLLGFFMINKAFKIEHIFFDFILCFFNLCLLTYNLIVSLLFHLFILVALVKTSSMSIPIFQTEPTELMSARFTCHMVASLIISIAFLHFGHYLVFAMIHKMLSPSLEFLIRHIFAVSQEHGRWDSFVHLKQKDVPHLQSTSRIPNSFNQMQ